MFLNTLDAFLGNSKPHKKSKIFWNLLEPSRIFLKFEISKKIRQIECFLKSFLEIFAILEQCSPFANVYKRFWTNCSSHSFSIPFHICWNNKCKISKYWKKNFLLNWKIILIVFNVLIRILWFRCDNKLKHFWIFF